MRTVLELRFSGIDEDSLCRHAQADDLFTRTEFVLELIDMSKLFQRNIGLREYSVRYRVTSFDTAARAATNCA